MVGIVGALFSGLFLPAPPGAQAPLGVVRTGAVVVLFFLYGARLRGREVWSGVRNWRLQLLTPVVTFVIYPLVGLAVSAALEPWLGVFSFGVLFTALLPSTVQTSITLTSIARGNVAGAVVAATVSNLAGVFLTPVLVMIYLGGEVGIGFAQFGKVAAQILLPFVVGQVAGRWIGNWLRARPRLTRAWDQSTLVLIVYISVGQATTVGAWESVSAPMLAALLVSCLLLLAPVLALTWWGGAALRLDRPDRIAFLMCGSVKALTSGLPMAAVLFPPELLAAATIPVVLFHQVQLVVKSVLAQRLAARSG
ncbi:bile acid:sodium symporter family protein [Buchananella felis]|uniref:bile acid:sodium symporter family protein n=1 Tax=Buchananella felis TaxID=3231492 RepID=UPI003528F565